MIMRNYYKRLLAICFAACLTVSGTGVFAVDDEPIADEYEIENKTESMNEVILSSYGDAEADSDYPGDIRFDFVTDTEKFTTSSATFTLKEKGIAVAETDNYKDPYIMVANLDIDLDHYKYIRIRAKDLSASKMMQVYLCEASGWKNLFYGVIEETSTAPDSDFKTYVFNIDDFVLQSETTGKPKSYKRLRVDFLNDVTVGKVEIDSIVISKYAESPSTEMIKSVSFGGETVDEFNPASDYCETVVYDDVYNALSTENMQIKLADGYENAKTSVKIGNITNAKTVDITVQKDEECKTYRIVCEKIKRPVKVTLDSCVINGYKISYSGTVKNEKNVPVSRPVTIVVYEDGKTGESDIEYMDVVLSNSEGKFSGEFELYDPETSARDCNLKVMFDAEGDENPPIATLSYINNKTVENYIETSKSDSDGIVGSIVKNDRVFKSVDIWSDLYNKQSGETKKAINDKTAEFANDLNVGNVFEVVNGNILAISIDGMSSADADKYLVKYADRTESFVVGETDFSDMSETERAAVFDIYAENTDAKDYKELQGGMREAMFVYMVNNAKYTEIEELLLSNTDILDDNLTALADETSSDVKKEAMRIVVKKADTIPFKNAAEIVKTVKSALSEAKEDKKENNNKHTTSSGGSSAGYQGITAPTPESQEDVKQNTFTDLGDYEWARDAITVLSDAKIVNGVGNNMYEPERSVTREEFVKILCEAFDVNTSVSTSKKFNDVDYDSWYAKYLLAATENEIVFGKDDSTFGVGESITREDLSVMIYRALAKRGVVQSGEANFADSSGISDYAKEAVGSLCNNGILSGTGNNMFEPNRNATRAETAVIVYRCIEKYGLR